MMNKILDWFNKYVWGEEEIEAGSLWISRTDLSENPFSQKKNITVHKVVEKRFGNGKAKRELFIKLAGKYGGEFSSSMSEYVFRSAYVPYNDETIEYWNLK